MRYRYAVIKARRTVAEATTRTEADAEARRVGGRVVDREAKAALAEVAPHLSHLAQRLDAADVRFLDYCRDQAGLTEPQARHVLHLYRITKSIKMDPHVGQFQVVHGSLLDPDTLRHAATLSVEDVTGRARNPAPPPQPSRVRLLKANPFSPAARSGLLRRMRADGALSFARKVDWVHTHMPHIADANAFVAALVGGQ